jgi:hypothetical protein
VAFNNGRRWARWIAILLAVSVGCGPALVGTVSGVPTVTGVPEATGTRAPAAVTATAGASAAAAASATAAQSATPRRVVDFVPVAGRPSLIEFYEEG